MIDDDDTVLLTSSTDSAGMNSTVIAEQEIYRNPSRYYEFVPDLYDACIKNISRYETWGDDVTLQPASNHYGLEIRVYTFYVENSERVIRPTDGNVRRAIQLSFYAACKHALLGFWIDEMGEEGLKCSSCCRNHALI